MFQFWHRPLPSSPIYGLFSVGTFIPLFHLVLYLLQLPNLAESSTSSEIRALSGRTLRDRLQKNSKTIPVVDSRKALRVLTGIYIESMGNFQATDMSFDVDLYLYMHWRDPSLNHSSEDYVLVNDPKVRDKMWLPDLYFANARNSKFHDVTAPNFNLFIDKTGNIAYSIRITLNVACNLDLANYPMDRQTCGIRIISYAYVESQVNVTWFAHNSTRYNPEIGLPEFKIEKLTPEYCDGTYMYAIMEQSYRRDKFSCLEAVIHLNRQIGYHLVQSFIPTALIVMISWVSFWIDRRAVPARVTLSFTTLLSLSTLGNGLRFGLPQVAYAKAIDFWFGSCMFFVFLSLVEFAAVNSYMREAEKYERLASYSAKKELRLHDENSRWSPDESCGESSLLIFGVSEPNTGLGSRLMSLASLAVPSLFFGTRKRKGGPKATPASQTMAHHHHHQAMGNGGGPVKMRTPNGRIVDNSSASCPLHSLADKKSSLGIRLSEHMELRSIDGDEADTLTPNTNMMMMMALRSQTPSPSPGSDCPPINNHVCNFSPAENRRNIIVPEIQPWPPSPYEPKGGHPPPPAPRRVRKINANSNQNERNPLATNHFLREGFRYSRKGLSIDRWSRILFPFTFSLWNIYYWVYYLWYIQTPHVDRSE